MSRLADTEPDRKPFSPGVVEWEKDGSTLTGYMDSVELKQETNRCY